MSIELFFVYVASGGFIVFAACMLCQVVRALLGTRSQQTPNGAAEAAALPAAPSDTDVVPALSSCAPPTAPFHGITFEPTVFPGVLPQSVQTSQPVIEHRDTPSTEQRPPEAPEVRELGVAKPAAREVAPLSYVSTPATRPATAVAGRSRPAIFEPDHYRRHAGMAGHLYMARNPFHFDGLYKLGYTTRTPQERINWLNTEHRQVPDVGEFHLVHAVKVPAAYDAERALFDLLGADRPVQKREFFLHSEALLKRALDATHAFTTGDAGALDDFVLSREQETAVGRPPMVGHAAVQPLLSPQGGWIYMTHCQWHRSSVYRISYTRKDPRLAISALDARQKRLTCRVGFHTLVHCVCVDDLKASWGKVAASLERWRVVGSKVFYEAPIAELSEAINQAFPVSPAPAARLNQSRNFGDVTVELVHSQVAPSWAAWARPCPGCGSVLRFTGTVGARGAVDCPACGCQLECTVGASKAVVSAKA